MGCRFSTGWRSPPARVRSFRATRRRDHGLLDAVGLLRAERAPVARDATGCGADRPGSATIAYPGPDGGELEPSVTVDDDLDIHFLLDLARNLRASLPAEGAGARGWATPSCRDGSAAARREARDLGPVARGAERPVGGRAARQALRESFRF